MSQGNLEMVRRCYEAVNRGDFETIFSVCDPAVEFEPPERAPYAGTYRGVDGVRELLQSLLEAWRDIRWEPERFFETGDRVVVFVKMAVRSQSSDAQIGVRVGHFWEMRDGKIMRFKIFPEREEALEAAGLSAARGIAPGAGSPRSTNGGDV
jgi:ketosteroid isomerase-like protein